GRIAGLEAVTDVIVRAVAVVWCMRYCNVLFFRGGVGTVCAVIYDRIGAVLTTVDWITGFLAVAVQAVVTDQWCAVLAAVGRIAGLEAGTAHVGRAVAVEWCMHYFTFLLVSRVVGIGLAGICVRNALMPITG